MSYYFLLLVYFVSSKARSVSSGLALVIIIYIFLYVLHVKRERHVILDGRKEWKLKGSFFLGSSRFPIYMCIVVVLRYIIYIIIFNSWIGRRRKLYCSRSNSYVFSSPWSGCRSPPQKVWWGLSVSFPFSYKNVCTGRVGSEAHPNDSCMQM